MFGACNSNRKFSESLLKATLQQADGNTGELSSVLEHYEDDPAKTRSRRISDNEHARSGQSGFGFVSNAQPYYDFLTEHVEKNGKYEDSRIYYYLCDSLQKVLPDSTKHIAEYYRTDAKFLSARFLIGHIDDRFDVWRNAPWKDRTTSKHFAIIFCPIKVTTITGMEAQRISGENTSIRFPAMRTVLMCRRENI